MTKAVLFDLGGTLLQGRGLGAPMDLGYKGAKAAYDRLKSMDVSLPFYPIYLARVTAAFASMAGAASGLKEVEVKRELGRFFEGMGALLDERQLDEALAAWFAPFAAEIRLNAAAPKVLEDVAARKLRMGIITNSVWPDALLDRHLQELKVGRFFEVIVSSADVGFRKPSPSIFAAALKRLDLRAANCVYVGDRRKEDVVGAQQVGMRSVLLRNPGADEPGPAPDRTIDALDALPSTLDSLA